MVSLVLSDFPTFLPSSASIDLPSLLAVQEMQKRLERMDKSLADLQKALDNAGSKAAEKSINDLVTATKADLEVCERLQLLRS